MLFLLLVCVVVDGLMMPTAESLEPRMHKGTVVSAGAGKISIKEEGGKEQSFAVEAMAKITVNGKPGRLEDFQESMPVQVTTDEKGRVLAVATMDGNKKGLASRT
jgi:hypothetical protein